MLDVTLAPLVFLDGRVIVHCGDSRVVLKTLAAASVDAVVTDPPYGLGFMGKAWDAPDGAAFAVEFWREVFRVLKPGGHLIGFSGTRTYHRMVVAIEDAGFEIRDQLAWMYGSGFPKSHDVAKAIDKLDAAAERRERALQFTAWMRSTGLTSERINAATSSVMASHYLTDKEQPSVATREHLELLRPLLTAPVPDWVEVLVDDRVVESENFKAREVVGHHDKQAHAATWRATYDGSGVAPAGAITVAHTPEAAQWEGWGTALKPAWEPIVLARKPLRGTVAENVLEHGTGALNIGACRVGEEVRVEQMRDIDRMHGGSYASQEVESAAQPIGEKEYVGRWPANVMHDGSDEVVSAFPEAPGAYAPVGPQYGAKDSVNTYGDWGPRQQTQIHGDSGSAARFFYTAKADAEDRLGSKHPTVKPLDLMQYYVRLVTPPGGVVLDPFAGTGTTGEAAWREGFAAVLIERDPDSLADIARRLDLAEHPSKRSAVAKGKGKLMGAEGTPLFGGEI